MKTVAATIVLSTLAAIGAEAEETKRRVAPPAVYEVAPGLGHFTDDILFGDVWARPELSARDRSLVTLAALVSTGKTAQISAHVRRGLDNGLEPSEIGELITQLAFYSGWPNAMSAVTETKSVFDERGIDTLGSSDGDRIELDAAPEIARSAAVEKAVAPTAPALAELTNRVLFGDLWRRSELAPRDRSLVAMAALIAIGQPEQLPFHANRAMDNGLTRSEAAEVATHFSFYAGWPRAMSAVPVLQGVFGAREAKSAEPASSAKADLRVVRAAAETGTPGQADRFTGTVTLSALYQGDAPARISGATVAFAAGARTAWHTHPLGQTLFIVSGRGWVQKAGGPVIEVGPGDVVWIPPHVKHWHGASAGAAMSHFAVAEALDGNVVTWMEAVIDEQYRSGQASDE
jgi:4-carboxymuconolactone decarboxylase